MGILNADVDEIEIIPLAKGIISRWWLIVLASVVGVAAMWSQESDLSTTPSSTKVVRVYESRDELAMLTLVGIDPITVSPFPSFDHQILQVKEPPIRTEIASKTGFDLDVSIMRSEQRFSLLDTVEGDGKTKFTFLSVGTPTYTFSCIDESTKKCNTVIDEYLERLSQLRKSSVLSGLDRIQSMLASLRLKDPAINDKLEAIESIKPLINGELALLSTTNLAIGGTVSTVKSSTYAFGFIGGAFVGLLIALQLTLIDKRVRTSGQIRRNFSDTPILGISSGNTSSFQQIAAAIVAQAGHKLLSAASLFPANKDCSIENFVKDLNLITSNLGVAVVAQQPVAEIDAQSLISSPQGAVVIAELGVTKIDEIDQALSILTSVNKTVLGIILMETVR